MHKFSGWIKHHQVAAFFVLTYAITWGLGFSYGAVLRRGQFLLAPLVFLATCGPALAGIILTTVANAEPRQGTRRAFWIAFLVAWVASALVFLTHMTFFNRVPLSLRMVGFGIVSVLPVAFVIGMAYSRVPAVRSYLASLIRLRGVWGWSALALVTTPALVLVSIPVASGLGRQPTTAQQLPSMGPALIGLVAVKFLYQFFFFNATGEEVGWCGFALPRLQARASPLIAALVLGFFWASWHLFLWRAEGQPVVSWQFWLQQWEGHALFSLLIVWIYNRSRGSILVAGITHAAANTAMAFVRLDLQVLCGVWAIVALVLVVADRMWAKLPPEHPAVCSLPASTA
jgi:membrane protease YdiL (CAAX protease family)